jgi:predicted enzyme related to lactoylglutathione lyase
MSDETKMPHGAIAWIDLTVSNAVVVRDFYKKVVGWDHAGCDMGGYEDFNMMPGGTETPVAGVCHAVGSNEGMPASWMIYITVPDVDAAAAKCVELGGEIVREPKGDSARFCVIRDPAGAVCALFETKD